MSSCWEPHADGLLAVDALPKKRVVCLAVGGYGAQPRGQACAVVGHATLGIGAVLLRGFHCSAGMLSASLEKLSKAQTRSQHMARTNAGSKVFFARLCMVIGPISIIQKHWLHTCS